MTPSTTAPDDGRYDTEHTTTSSADTLTRQEATAWRCLTHGLGVDLRRRLIPLVRTNLVALEAACRILQAAGLSPLPRIWTLHLTLACARPTDATALERAFAAGPGNREQGVRQALDPNVTITVDRLPHRRAAGPGDGPVHGPYEASLLVTLTAQVRACTGDDARAHALAAVHRAVAALPAPAVDLPAVQAVVLDPDPRDPTDLSVDRDAPDTPYTPPPSREASTEATTARYLAAQAWHHRVRQIRSALIEALRTGDLDDRPGAHAPYQLVDDLLRGLGLPGLPTAHLYEITAAIPLTVTADSPTAARIAAYHLARDAFALQQQYGLPITLSAMVREPTIHDSGTGTFQVTWHETYLVCLRAAHSPRLAEEAVRLQLSVLSDTVAAPATIPLQTAYLGEHADHRLEAHRD
ncbi:hypothetical protein [Micromonospora sp. NPDC049497]|uniref:hypothetical protein n=1 Tax=Micromonospora sp. NPDC049497 TaxID=3364273 RepID=UPI0037AD77F4